MLYRGMKLRPGPLVSVARRRLQSTTLMLTSAGLHFQLLNPTPCSTDQEPDSDLLATRVNAERVAVARVSAAERNTLRYGHSVVLQQVTAHRQ